MLIFAKVINFFLHPVVLVTPAVFFVAYGSGETLWNSLFWALVSLGFTAFTSLYVLFGIRMGFFSNFDVSKREQRFFLFPVVILVGIIYFFTVFYFNGPRFLLFALVYFLISVAILALVTFKIKASIHVGSISAAIVSSIYFFGTEYLFLLILIPIMIWARIKEKRHTFKETIVGLFLGLMLAIAGIFSVQYFM